MTEREKRIQRMFAGLGPAVDEADPAPSTRTPITESEQQRQRELALLDVQVVQRPALTERMKRDRVLAGLSEDGSYGPPAVALRGASAFIAGDSNRGDISAPIDAYYSAGRTSGGGGSLVQPGGQSAPVHPLTSPDPDAAAAARLQQALDVCREALRLRRPLYRAAVQFCCDQVEFAVDLGVNGWVAPDDVFIGGANVFSTLKDALADSGELDVSQVAQVAAQLTAALAALRGGEQAERTVAKRGKLLVEQGTFQVLETQEVSYQGANLLRIRGTCLRGDERNGNNRRYSSSLLQKQALKLSSSIKAGNSLFGALDHPTDGVSRLAETAIMWTGIEWDAKRKEIIGTGLILPTSRGSDARKIIECGGRIGISARGHGVTTTAPDGVEDVSEASYNLVSFDLVTGQSVPGAIAEPIA